MVQFADNDPATLEAMSKFHIFFSVLSYGFRWSENSKTSCAINYVYILF